MPLLFLMSIGSSTFVSLSGLLMVITWYKPWLLPRPSLWTRGREGPARLGELVLPDSTGGGRGLQLRQPGGQPLLGAAEVTPYSVTWRFVGLAAVLQSLIFPALWPAYAEAYARRDYSWIRSMFSRVMKATLAFNCRVVVWSCCSDVTAIRVWAGPAAVPSPSLLCAMGVWAIISGFMSVESCLLAALNRTREQAVLSVIAAVVNLALSIGIGAAYWIAGRDPGNDFVVPGCAGGAAEPDREESAPGNGGRSRPLPRTERHQEMPARTTAR